MSADGPRRDRRGAWRACGGRWGAWRADGARGEPAGRAPGGAASRGRAGVSRLAGVGGGGAPERGGEYEQPEQQERDDVDGRAVQAEVADLDDFRVDQG